MVVVVAVVVVDSIPRTVHMQVFVVPVVVVVVVVVVVDVVVRNTSPTQHCNLSEEEQQLPMQLATHQM